MTDKLNNVFNNNNLQNLNNIKHKKQIAHKRKVHVSYPLIDKARTAVDANPLETLLTKFNIHKEKKKKIQNKQKFQKKAEKKWLRKRGMRRCLKLLRKRKRAPASKAFLRKDAM